MPKKARRASKSSAPSPSQGEVFISGLGYKRDDLKALADTKLEDAVLLLQHRRFSNAYYLGGYAIEIALKVCIARQFVADVIPDKAFVNQVFNHKLSELIGLAGLTAELKSRENAEPAFAASWAMVAQWDPETRYASIDPTTAQQFFVSIRDPTSGVMPWIKTFW